MKRYTKPTEIRIFWSPDTERYAVQSPPGGALFVNDVNLFCDTARWDGTNKIWLILPEDLDSMVDILTRHHGKIPTVERKPEPTAFVAKINENLILRMFEAAGPEISSKIYKMMIKEYHPDSGTEPSHDKCAAITVGYREIKAALHWK